MAYDRFVIWNDKRPTLEEIESGLRRYIGDAAKEITNRGTADKPWWIVTLHGVPKYPFDDVASPYDERWFEICCTNLKNNIDIMTRGADPYTNSVAKGFADYVAHYFGAKADYE